MYASEMLSLGLFHEEFRDCIREGDGERVLRCWKFMLLLFKASKRTNYSLEALRLLLQHHFLLPPRQAQQLLHSHFVNTRGLPGHNVSCDIHMEHLNRLCKSAVEGLEANKIPDAIVCSGKCIQQVSEVMDRFDQVHSRSKDSSSHSRRSEAKDLERALKTIHDKGVFQSHPGRTHDSYSKLSDSLMSTVKTTVLESWIKDHLPRNLCSDK